MATQERTIKDLVNDAKDNKDKLFDLDDFYVVLSSLVATYNDKEYFEDREQQRATVIQEIGDDIAEVSDETQIQIFTEAEQLVLRAEFGQIKQQLEDGQFTQAQTRVYEMAELIITTMRELIK